MYVILQSQHVDHGKTTLVDELLKQSEFSERTNMLTKEQWTQ